MTVPERRSFLRAILGFAGACASGRSTWLREEQMQPVPWSAGSKRPATLAPRGSTDCHFHIYDALFPFASSAVLKPAPATVADYRLLQRRLGTTRCVLVQPSSYGTDNSCLLGALKQFGPSIARGIAVVNTGVSTSELKEMHEAGVRGIRFNFLQAGATTIDMLEPLAKQVAALGWHVQINASPHQIVSEQSLLTRLPCPLVLDHFAHTIPAGRDDPAFDVIVQILQSGKGWLKLSGVYMDSKLGPPSYADSIPVARAYVAEAPGQLVWGTDWPHPTTQEKPDDAAMFDLLAHWVPDASTRSKILVDNPSKLYGFASTGDK